jgi:hypothetical protein
MRKRRENLADVDRYIEKIKSEALKRYMTSIHN